MSRNFELLNQLDADLHFGIASQEAVRKKEQPLKQALRDSFNRGLLNLAQTVFLSDAPNAPRVVALCGVAGESRTTDICLDLGKILAAQSARPTCLITCNGALSRLSSCLNADRPVSFPKLGHDNCREISPNLWLTTLDGPASSPDAGPAPAQILKQRLDSLRMRFQFILIDAPGASAGGDGAVRAKLADGSILVIEANLTRKAAALQAKKTMEAMNIRIFGSVLNNRAFPIPERLYHML